MTDFKALPLLEISLLHCSNYDWSPAVAGSVLEGKVLCAVLAGEVLGSAAPADDTDDSGEEQAAPAAVPAAAAAPAPAHAAAAGIMQFVEKNRVETRTSGIRSDGIYRSSMQY